MNTSVQSDSSETLVELAKKGDREAFHSLYSLHVKRLLSFSRKMLNNRAEAEEVVQEAFLLVFRKLLSLKENLKFESWLFQVTRNLIYARYRKRSVQINSLETEQDLKEQLEDIATLQLTPEEKVLENEKMVLAHRAIQCLPPKMKDIFLLSVFQDFSYQEIGEITGRSLGVVKSDIFRARMMIRDYISAQMKDKK